ncbi:MAG TPA: site-2 protease family protein [Geminicoccaceae bacterium]|nr:site-2 protease family protein [Geminicoccaceae bacterium]
MDLATVAQALSVWFLPVILAITFHEAAHGWMAERCGDGTARMLGRVSFNPIRHVDPFGTLLLPALLLLLKAPFLFGYAKPVPVDFRRLRNPRRDMIWVALAGPGANVLLAFAAALLLHPAAYAPAAVAPWLGENLANAIFFNVVLAVFNMLPLPPLDGGRVLTGILPHRAAWRFARLEPYGLLILLGLLFLVPFGAQSLLGIEFNPLFEVLWPPIVGLYGLILDLTGLA